MSVRNLDKMFAPQSVALTGSTARPSSVGAVVARPLRRRFCRRLDAGQTASARYRRHDCLPQCRRPAIAFLISELSEREARACGVLAEAFGATEERSRMLEQAALDAARPNLMRTLGPNCVGIMVPRFGLDATHSHLTARPGDVAFLS
jgi:acetyltransferase